MWLNSTLHQCWEQTQLSIPVGREFLASHLPLPTESTESAFKWLQWKYITTFPAFHCYSYPVSCFKYNRHPGIKGNLPFLFFTPPLSLTRSRDCGTLTNTLGQHNQIRNSFQNGFHLSLFAKYLWMGRSICRPKMPRELRCWKWIQTSIMLRVDPFTSMDLGIMTALIPIDVNECSLRMTMLGASHCVLMIPLFFILTF